MSFQCGCSLCENEQHAPYGRRFCPRMLRSALVVPAFFRYQAVVIWRGKRTGRER